MNSPLVSIIILNYNQIEVTISFLESSKKLNYDNYEIILIDNKSETDPKELISNKYDKLIYIRSDKNLGFTGGNNLAFEHSSGEFIFIVNNDTELTPEIINELLIPFKDKEVGITCPKIKFYDHPEIIQYAGFNPINIYTGRGSAVGSKAVDNGQYDNPGFTHYAHGAAMLVRRSIIEKIGLFPEFFFIYYEELDFSVRVKKTGFKIFFQPSAVIYHKESITMGKESPMKVYYMNRNRILFMRRNSDLGSFIIFTFFFIIFAVPKNSIKYLLKGQIKHFKSFYKAVFWNLSHKSNKK